MTAISLGSISTLVDTSELRRRAVDDVQRRPAVPARAIVGGVLGGHGWGGHRSTEDATGRRRPGSGRVVAWLTSRSAPAS